MPIYEYYCSKCKAKFELMRPLSKAGEAASCSKCHSPAERVMSRFASFSMNEGGTPAPVGGSSCVSCGSSDCSTCGI